MGHIGKQLDLPLHTGLFAAKVPVVVVYNEDSHKESHSRWSKPPVPKTNQQPIK